MRKPIAQGDVMLIPAEALPDGLRSVERVNGRLILAEGEVTGHHHSIVAVGVELLEPEVQEIPGIVERFLRVCEGDAVALTHQEHDTVTLAPGLWAVRSQREFCSGQIARVRD